MIRLDQPRRRTSESVVPMINVAFLLLIFFLMVAVIAPPDPVAVVLPAGETGQDLVGQPDLTLTVSRRGEVFADGDVAADLSEARGRGVVIRADAAVDASRVARLMADLSANGAASIQLAVSPR